MMWAFLFGLLLGAFALVTYFVVRMLRSDGWDKSNVLNALRLLWHILVHPEDFGQMYYISDQSYLNLGYNGGHLKRPFWYVSKDEFSEVVATRPEDKT